MTEPLVAKLDNAQMSVSGRTASGKTALGSGLAAVALALVAVLALSRAVEPSSADLATLFFLALGSACCLLPPWRAYFEESSDNATLVLTVAFFVIYGLARRAGPDEGPALHLHLLPETAIVIPYAAYLVCVGALISLVPARPVLAPVTRALLAAMVLLAVLALVSFKLLGQYYAVGATRIVNPEFYVYTLLQVIEYCAVLLLCNAAAAHATTRRLALRALPLVLLILWARHEFGPAATEDDE